MFKFLSTKKTNVFPYEYKERKIEWNIRSINSVLPEEQIKNPHPIVKL